MWSLEGFEFHKINFKENCLSTHLLNESLSPLIENILKKNPKSSSSTILLGEPWFPLSELNSKDSSLGGEMEALSESNCFNVWKLKLKCFWTYTYLNKFWNEVIDVWIVWIMRVWWLLVKRYYSELSLWYIKWWFNEIILTIL